MLCLPGVDPPEHGVISFVGVAGLDFLIFCWGYLCLCSCEKLVCSFLVMSLSGFDTKVMCLME